MTCVKDLIYSGKFYKIPIKNQAQAKPENSSEIQRMLTEQTMAVLETLQGGIQGKVRSIDLLYACEEAPERQFWLMGATNLAVRRERTAAAGKELRAGLEEAKEKLSRVSQSFGSTVKYGAFMRTYKKTRLDVHRLQPTESSKSFLRNLTKSEDVRSASKKMLSSKNSRTLSKAKISSTTSLHSRPNLFVRYGINKFLHKTPKAGGYTLKHPQTLSSEESGVNQSLFSKQFFNSTYDFTSCY